MNKAELDTRIRQKIQENGNIEMHEKVARHDVYQEMIFEKLDDLPCKEHRKDIDMLKRIVYTAMGGGAVILFLIKYIL